MFITHPRPKKSILPTFSRKRKAVHNVEAIDFDNDARAEYLTGFHKRKLQRVKRAQEENAKKDKQEKLETRKQVRHQASSLTATRPAGGLTTAIDP